MKEIVVERLLPAPPEAVFAAWTDPADLGRWLVPGEMTRASVELDFRVGGRFRVAMHGEEQDYVQHGEYLEIDPPKRLVFTWVSEWMPEGEQHTRVSVSFEPVGADLTRLRLVHDQLPEGDGYEGHRGGWTSIVDKLAARLKR
jgi:uncharacterized protein YndB with AHSA1/START domain